MDSVTSTAGGLTNTTACIKDHLLISREQLQEEKKKKTDRPGYSNKHNGTPSCFTGEKKRSRVQHTHTHTHKYFQIL